MSKTDVISIALVSATMAVALIADMVRDSDCGYRVKIRAGYIMLPLSLLLALASLSRLWFIHPYDVPRNTANGVLATLIWSVITIFIVLRRLPPIGGLSRE